MLVNVIKIANFLDCKYIGEDILINGYSDIKDIKENSIVFLNKHDSTIIEKINTTKNIIVICNEDMSRYFESNYIICNNPRMSFIKVVEEFFSKPIVRNISKNSVNLSKKVGVNFSLGNYSTIECGAIIGDDVSIGNNVTIKGCVEIGNGSVIKSGAVIGEDGFGFEFDEKGVPHHFPHIGKVIIGENVMIGSNSTVERGTILNTIICDNVKIDDLVQIGHNTNIGNNTLIMVGALVLGGVKIGKQCWIAPNTTIREKIIIEDNASTGIGSVVVKNVKNGELVYGVPAKPKTE